MAMGDDVFDELTDSFKSTTAGWVLMRAKAPSAYHTPKSMGTPWRWPRPLCSSKLL